MRRFRLRRRRYAPAVLFPIAAILPGSALADSSETPKRARIDVSAHAVPAGEPITVRGAFPGASKAAIELRFRAQGSKVWHARGHVRTGAGGRYAARVRPHASGYWRAELTAEPALASGSESVPEATSAPTTIDAGTGTEHVLVRSRTKARIGDRNPTVGDPVRVRGRVAPAGERRRVIVRVGGDRIVTRAGRDGRFEAEWRARATGRFPVRARARSNRTATGSADAAGRVTVYRPATASWYGPGLYGNAVACGGTLSPSTLGVAHRSLPCGTKLRLRYGGRSVAVRVIDRGPFVAGREFDLTAATKQALGFPDVGTVLSSR